MREPAGGGACVERGRSLRIVRAGATAAGSEVRSSGRSTCNLAGGVATLASATFDLQHDARANCLRPFAAADETCAQREHSFLESWVPGELAPSVDMRVHAHAFDAGPGSDSIVSARTSQANFLRSQKGIRPTSEGATPRTVYDAPARLGFQAKELQGLYRQAPGSLEPLLFVAFSVEIVFQVPVQVGHRLQARPVRVEPVPVHLVFFDQVSADQQGIHQVGGIGR